MKFGIIPVTPYQQNCSLLWCEKTNKVAIIDPGGDIPSILHAIEQVKAEPVKILITHGHMDHCAAAKQLAEQLKIPIIGPHIDDKFWIDSLPETCQMAGFPPAEAFEPQRWLHDGDLVNVGDIHLQVIHTPGHTPGHVVFFHPDTKIAFVGDVLFQGSIGRTDFPKGDHQTLINSIKKKLWPLGDDVTFVPGHGPTSTFGQERQTNPFVADTQYG